MIEQGAFIVRTLGVRFFRARIFGVSVVVIIAIDRRY